VSDSVEKRFKTCDDYDIYMNIAKENEALGITLRGN
jgi:hypothetical protein